MFQDKYTKIYLQCYRIIKIIKCMYIIESKGKGKVVPVLN
jgi:hypothetical protein